MAYGTECSGTQGLSRRLWPYRFSNPNHRVGGVRIRVRGDRTSERTDGPAFAARHPNRMRRYVANYRRAPCLSDGGRVRLQASSGEYVVAVANGGGPVRAPDGSSSCEIHGGLNPADGSTGSRRLLPAIQGGGPPRRGHGEALKNRTLMNPTTPATRWLVDAHEALDTALAAAYWLVRRHLADDALRELLVPNGRPAPSEPACAGAAEGANGLGSRLTVMRRSAGGSDGSLESGGESGNRRGNGGGPGDVKLIVMDTLRE